MPCPSFQGVPVQSQFNVGPRQSLASGSTETLQVNLYPHGHTA